MQNQRKRTDDLEVGLGGYQVEISGHINKRAGERGKHGTSEESSRNGARKSEMVELFPSALAEGSYTWVGAHIAQFVRKQAVRQKIMDGLYIEAFLDLCIRS